MQSKSNILRIYLADDHAIMREGLKHILSQIPDCQIVGENGDGAAALEEIEREKPDLVLLDISMPSMTGIEIARKLKRYHPGIKIIILSRHENEEYVKQIMKYGVQGYVLKEDAGSDLIKAVETVRNGGAYLSSRLTHHLFDAENTATRHKKSDASIQPFAVLTNREREILKLVAEGKTNEEISRLLRIEVQTVKTHRQNIMNKLNIHNVSDLTKYAIKAGLIELG